MFRIMIDNALISTTNASGLNGLHVDLRGLLLLGLSCGCRIR